jgi:hypothetical protein
MTTTPATTTKTTTTTKTLFYLIVVWTIGAFFDRSVFLLVSDLNANHRVHVEPGQLSGFDHSDANLEISFLIIEEFYCQRYLKDA